MLSAAIILAIAIAIYLGYKTSLNTGLFCIVFAYLIGCLVMGLKPTGPWKKCPVLCCTPAGNFRACCPMPCSVWPWCCL